MIEAVYEELQVEKMLITRLSYFCGHP